MPVDAGIRPASGAFFGPEAIPNGDVLKPVFQDPDTVRRRSLKVGAPL
jgi:hypothetical protein